MTMDTEVPAYATTPDSFGQKSSRRQRADAIKPFICKHLIAVLENPSNITNIAIAIRNINALGVEKLYVIDGNNVLPDGGWDEIRKHRSLNKISVSASKWSFVKTFKTTDECFDHLELNRYHSVVTSPHVKGKDNAYLHEVNFTVIQNLAIWFGTETDGISPRAVERCLMCVSIPMFGMIESLNLGTSTGIVLYEATKQRREYQSKFRNKGRRGVREEPLPVVMAQDR